MMDTENSFFFNCSIEQEYKTTCFKEQGRLPYHLNNMVTVDTISNPLMLSLFCPYSNSFHCSQNVFAVRCPNQNQSRAKHHIWLHILSLSLALEESFCLFSFLLQQQSLTEKTKHNQQNPTLLSCRGLSFFLDLALYFLLVSFFSHFSVFWISNILEISSKPWVKIKH